MQIMRSLFSEPPLWQKLLAKNQLTACMESENALDSVLCSQNRSLKSCWLLQVDYWRGSGGANVCGWKDFFPLIVFHWCAFFMIKVAVGKGRDVECLFSTKISLLTSTRAFKRNSSWELWARIENINEKQQRSSWKIYSRALKFSANAALWKIPFFIFIYGKS